jgi:hypothetical protein
MTDCEYEQFDERTTRVTGQRYVPVQGPVTVKIEGSGRVGEKYLGIAGVRDPYTIANIDKVVELAKEQVAEEFPDLDYKLAFTIYGKNGVMGDLEPVKEARSHELGIAIEGIADTAEQAEAVTLFATRQLFYARLPEVKGTAGTAAFLTDEVLRATASYRWTINHILPVEDPMSLFDLHLVDVSANE